MYLLLRNILFSTSLNSNHVITTTATAAATKFYELIRFAIQLS